MYMRIVLQKQQQKEIKSLNKSVVKRKPEVSTSASRAWFLQSLARSYIKNVRELFNNDTICKRRHVWNTVHCWILCKQQLYVVKSGKIKAPHLYCIFTASFTAHWRCHQAARLPDRETPANQVGGETWGSILLSGEDGPAPPWAARPAPEDEGTPAAVC